MPPTYKLIEHARKHRNRSKIEKVKEHAANHRGRSLPPYVPESPPFADYSPLPPYVPESPPFADYSPLPPYVPESPPYAPAQTVRSILRRPGSRSRPRRVSHSHSQHEREYELENEVDNAGNVHVRSFRPETSFREIPGLMKTRTGALIGDDAAYSTRYYSTEARMQSVYGPCFDEEARMELVRVLDMMHGIQSAMQAHADNFDGDVDIYEDLQVELEDLIQQKRRLFERCGYDFGMAFGRLQKAAKKTKSSHKRKKYERLMFLLSL